MLQIFKRRRGQTIKCQLCSKPYYVTPIEISFAVSREQPLANLCWVCRHRQVPGAEPVREAGNAR